LVVIPLATTIWLATTVSRFVLAFLTSIPKQFNPFNTLHPLLQELINLGLGLLVPLLGILLIGLMARNIVGRWLLEFGEGTLLRIPVAGSVYKTLKQLLETFLRDNSSTFVGLCWWNIPGRVCMPLASSPERWEARSRPISVRPC
jgi:uncharacterized membrane protein